MTQVYQQGKVHAYMCCDACCGESAQKAEFIQMPNEMTVSTSGRADASTFDRQA